ncbi:MAG: fasciclin domain-containing protein [Sphingopyxis sp.]|uniref:fasciclin domain-containing protein n=1 Tax=Sphingopyxis sp. TaxID=1908224 RepID=UPI003D6C9BFF
MKITHLTSATLVAVLALSACSKSETPPPTETAVEGSTATPTDTASANPMVGGAEMFPTKTIVDNAIASPIHKTLVAAVTQAGLVDTLKGPGPFTVFAPTDDAFAKVPKATLDGLMRPAQKTVLADVLKYHVVAGKLTAADLAKQITDGGGKAMLKTVNGQELTATMAGNVITLAGADGSKATVTQADVNQSNGVIHVVDGVLTPKM